MRCVDRLKCLGWELVYLLRIKKVSDLEFGFSGWAEKTRAIEAIKEEIDTLVLGSSHAQMGWWAEGREFNWGLAYEDLYTAYEIYRKWGRGSRVKDIIVFYSVFSPGDNNVLSPSKGVSVGIKAATGIDWLEERPGMYPQLEGAVWKCRRKCRRHLKRNKPLPGDLGNERMYLPFKTATAEERALAHLKGNKRNSKMNVYLEKLIEDADKVGQKVWIVVPPASGGYREALKNEKDMFSGVESFARRYSNTKLLNHFYDDDFTDDDFIDWDHLNNQGAKKLTSKVRQEMVAI